MLTKWLHHLVDPALADSVLGDLEEQRRKRARTSPVRATLWFWQAVLGVAFYALPARAASAARALTRNPLVGRGLPADLRYAVRSLRRAPWYSGAVIGVIALGMALAATVFAVVDGVLFRPLPYPNARSLFAIEPGFSGVTPKFPPAISAIDLANWTRATPGAVVTGFSVSRWVGLGEGVNEQAYGVAQVQQNFFEAIGVWPLIGGFTAADFDRRSPVWPVIISYAFWQGRFQGASDVIGRTVIADPSRRSGYRIVGVMPRGFEFPSAKAMVNIITPDILDEPARTDPRRRTFTEAIVRGPAGMTAGALRSRVEAGMAETAASFPARGAKPTTTSDRAWRMGSPFDRAGIRPLASALGSAQRPLFQAVLLASLILLVLASLNISGLMAARALDRSRELGLRRALGAGGAGIARLVLIEALLLLGAGASIALLLSRPLLGLIVRLLPEEVVLLKAAAIDWRVAGFAAISVATLVAATSVWPIRRALRARAATLPGGARASERTRSHARMAIVAGQTAGAVVLTVAGALLVNSVLAVYAHEPAIRTGDVVAIDTFLMGAGGEMNQLSPVRNQRVDAVLARLRTVPGVAIAAATNAQVLRGGSWPSWFQAPAGAANPQVDVDVQAVTPDYYRVVQPVLVAGRLPTEAELTANDRVVVVSEGVARAYWPGTSAVGHTLSAGADRTIFTVVGVVKDVRWWSWDRDVASVYGPYALLGTAPFPTFLVRTSADVGRVTHDVQDAMAEADPLMRQVRSATLGELFADSVQLRRLQAWLFGAFAVAALIVVGAGVLGLMAMSMARRVREMGIRIALGSTRGGVLALALREQLTAVLVGLVAGAVATAWTVRFLQVYLYELTAYDPRTWTIACLAIVLTATIGTLIPAARASRINPMEALREE